MIFSIKTNSSCSSRDSIEYRDRLCLRGLYLEPRNSEMPARECKGVCNVEKRYQHTDVGAPSEGGFFPQDYLSIALSFLWYLEHLSEFLLSFVPWACALWSTRAGHHEFHTQSSFPLQYNSGSLLQGSEQRCCRLCSKWILK